MAKGDVTMKFDAQTAAFVQDVQRAREKMEATADSARKLGDAMGRAGEKAADSSKKIMESATSGAVAGAAFGALSVKVGEYLQTIEDRTDRAVGKIRTLNAALAGAGQATAAPELRNRIEALPATVDREKATGMIAAISQNVPTISTDDKFSALDAALKGKKTGMSDEKATELGINFAKLAKFRRPGGGFDFAGNEELGAYADVIATEIPGGLSDRQLQFVARSQNKPRAINLLRAAAESAERSKTLTKLQEEAETEIDPAEVKRLERERKHPKHRGEFAAEDQRKLDLAKIPAGELRLSAMLENRNLVAPKDRQGVEDLQEGLRNLRPIKTLDESIAEARAAEDPQTKQVRAVGQAANVLKNNEFGVSNRLKIKAQQDNIQAELQEAHPKLPEWYTGLEAWIQARTGHGLILERPKPPGYIAPAGDGGIYNAVKGIIDRATETPGPQSRAGDAHLDVLERIHDQLNRQNTLMRTRRDTDLTNGRVEQA